MENERKLLDCIMEIRFQTKEESNKLAQEEFLKLAPVDRFYAFLALSEQMKDFPQKTRQSDSKSGNFQIVINSVKS